MRNRFSLLCLAVAFAFLAACGQSAADKADAAASITAALEEYLPFLRKVYLDGDIETLRPYAAEKELARIHALVQSLVDQGRYLAPEFQHLTVEGTHTWNNSNAFVTTVEVWNVRMHALGSGELLAEDVGESYRVKYQLKRDRNGWRVLFRAIQE